MCGPRVLPVHECRLNDLLSRLYDYAAFSIASLSLSIAGSIARENPAVKKSSENERHLITTKINMQYARPGMSLLYRKLDVSELHYSYFYG